MGVSTETGINRKMRKMEGGKRKEVWLSCIQKKKKGENYKQSIIFTCYFISEV